MKINEFNFLNKTEKCVLIALYSNGKKQMSEEDIKNYIDRNKLFEMNDTQLIWRARFVSERKINEN
mgnify:CR=1 FL=1